MVIKRINWNLILYVSFIALVAYETLLFALFPPLRQKTSSRLKAIHHSIFKASEQETITEAKVPERKPPPPVIERTPVAENKPAPRIAVVISPGPRRTGRISTRRSEQPKLHRESASAEIAGQGPEPSPFEERPAVNPRGSKDSQEAYQVLLNTSKRMADLVANANPNLKYKTWALVKSDGDEYWIDIVLFNKTASEDIHYIWRVNLASKEIKPESHEAKKIYVM